MLPSFLEVTAKGLEHEEVEGRIRFAAEYSSIKTSTFLATTGLSRYGAENIGALPGGTEIANVSREEEPKPVLK